MKSLIFLAMSVGLLFGQASLADNTIDIIDCGKDSGCQVDVTGSGKYPYQMYCSNGRTVLFSETAFININGKRACAKVRSGRLTLTCTSQSKKCR